jgi:phage shock protein A
VSSLSRGDDISRELDAMSSQSDVESELAALKAGASGTEPQQALESGDTTPPAGQVSEAQKEEGTA